MGEQSQEIKKPCCQKYSDFRQRFISLVEGFERLVDGNPRELVYLYDYLKNKVGVDMIVYVTSGYGCPVCDYPPEFDLSDGNKLA